MPSPSVPWSPSPSPSMSSRSSARSSASSPMAWWPPRSEKYTSKTVSKAFQWAWFFTSVAASAYLNASRSSRGMCWTASMASRFSVRLTGSPALRSSWMKPVNRSSMRRRPSSSGLLGRVGDRKLLGRLGDVRLVLEQDVQRLLGLVGVDVLDAQQQERARPVDRLGNRRMLLQLQRAQRADDARDLVGEMLADARHPREHDLLLTVELGIVDVQEQAAPLERLAQLARVVRREEHERDLCRCHGAELGDRNLVVGEDLQQERLCLHLD